MIRMKYFAHPELDNFRKERLKPNFHVVKVIKPSSSRAESSENYFMCLGWKDNQQVSALCRNQ